MSSQFKRSPAPRGDAKNRANCLKRPAFNITSRFELEAFAHRLHACGPRVIYEMLADLSRGRNLAETLADFARLDPFHYAALMALLISRGHA